MKKKQFKTVMYDDMQEFKIHANFNCKEFEITYNEKCMYFDFRYSSGLTKERHQYDFKEGEDRKYFIENC